MLFFGMLFVIYVVEDVVRMIVVGSDFVLVCEVLVEVIEVEGLVVSVIILFNDMLVCMVSDLEKVFSLFVDVVIVQFCSSVLVWQLLEEEVSQIVFCLFFIVIYVCCVEFGQVMLVYCLLGNMMLGWVKVEKLLV